MAMPCGGLALLVEPLLAVLIRPRMPSDGEHVAGDIFMTWQKSHTLVTYATKKYTAYLS
jgi:hypothetical protein